MFGILLTDLTTQHVCARPNPCHGFSNVMSRDIINVKENEKRV
jgi:hypothetical protein